MTVSSQTSNETYHGNGVTTVWDLPFRFFDNADIFVYQLDPATNFTTPLVLGTDYTLTGAGLPEQFGTAPGKLTTTAPIASGKLLYVERVMAVEQLTDILNQQRFFPEVHEDVFDRLTMLTQQISSSNNGAIRVAVGDPNPNRLPPAAVRANLLMSFDNAGNPIAVAPANGSAAALALLLASPAGASNVFGQLNATGTIAQSIQAYMRNKVFVGQFGAVCDGVTNDAPAIRKALDAIPADGGAIGFPDWSTCKVVGTIYIPQRIPVSGVAGQGVQLYGNNCTLIGDGSSVIFESGTGTKSTVALGGASNWPLGNELPTTLHYNSRIEGFNFKACGTAMKLKNWVQGCAVAKCYATDFTDHMLWTSRSFYLGQTDLTGRPFRNDRTDLTPIFRHDGFNNTMSFTGVHGSGIGPDGFTHGTGIGFDGGVEGLVLGNGLSFEGCKHGVLLNSIIYSLDINGVYFELCDYGIRSIGANLNHLNVDNCRFNACSTNINVDNWIDGAYGPGNDSQSGLVVFGNGCTHTVHTPARSLTDLNHTAWISKPAGWTVPAGCQIRRNDMIFNSAVGFSAVWFRNNPDSSGGNTGIVPMSFTGDCTNIGGIIPYCTVTGVGTGTLTIDTKILWSANMSAVRFDLLVNHSSAATIAGVLSANNVIFRDDAVAGITITPANNGGFLRLTLSGFGTITSFSGRVRII